MKKLTEKAYPERPSRYLTGTPEQFLKELEKMKDRGVDRALLRLLDYPRKNSLHLFRDEVIPKL